MINIATMGMFKSCCVSGGGGAPPYRANSEERVTPVVFVRNVEMITLDRQEDIIQRIQVTLKDDS